MKLDRAAIVLRPRTVPEIVDLAFRLSCSFALPLYSKLAALVLLPIFAGAMALRYAAKWEWFGVWMITIAAASIAQGVYTVAASRVLLPDDRSVGAVLRAFGRKLFSYLMALIASRFILGASALVVVGIPFAWVGLLFVHEASLLEGAGPAQACQRASRFVRGRGWNAAALLILLLAGQFGAVLVVELLAQGLLDEVLQLGKPFGSLWQDGGTPFAILGFLLSLPLVSTARFLHYIDTRTRADGWDVQVRFMAIASKDTSERRLAA